MSLTPRDAKWIHGLTQRADPVRKAIILAALGSSRYTVKVIDTGATIAATAAQSGQTYAVGKEVLLQTGASGRYSRSAILIIGYSQAAENGAIVGLVEARRANSSETVTQLPALPVLLVSGGPAARFTIFGERLTTAPASYGHAGITNATAAAIASTCLRLHVQASGAVPKGRYELTVAGVTVANFFEVV
jgi:hypothetical protein